MTESTPKKTHVEYIKKKTKKEKKVVLDDISASDSDIDLPLKVTEKTKVVE
jgi:hypothetical protein